jgi:hypothetical protein
MAAANTTPLASGLRNGDDGLEQHKGPVGWTARAFDSTHRSSAGESGRRVISRHLTRRRFHAYRLGLSRMVELRRARNDLNRLAQIPRRRNRRACDRGVDTPKGLGLSWARANQCPPRSKVRPHLRTEFAAGGADEIPFDARQPHMFGPSLSRSPRGRSACSWHPFLGASVRRSTV